MSRAAYLPSRVAIAEALTCMRDMDAERTGQGALGKVHQLLSQDPPDLQAAARAAAAGAAIIWPRRRGQGPEESPDAWLLAAVHELLGDAGASGTDSVAAATQAASALPPDDDEVFRLALGAVCEISALVCSARRLIIGSADEDATAVALMMARVEALSEALCPVLDRTAVDVAELRALVRFTVGGAA